MEGAWSFYKSRRCSTCCMMSGTLARSVKTGNLNSAALEGHFNCVALECEVFLINQAGSQHGAGRILVMGGGTIQGLEKLCQMSAA